MQQCEAKGRILPRCFKILFHKERLKIYSVQLYLLSVIFFFRSYLLQCISVTKRNPSKKNNKGNQKSDCCCQIYLQASPFPQNIISVVIFLPFSDACLQNLQGLYLWFKDNVDQWSLVGNSIDT